MKICVLYSLTFILALGQIMAKRGGGSAAPDYSAIYQDSARPLGYQIVDEVQQAASDADSTTFYQTEMPQLLDFVEANLSDSQALQPINGVYIDPASIQLATESNVRVYFLSEGASYHNTLGFRPIDASGNIGTTSLIFPDASSANQDIAYNDLVVDDQLTRRGKRDKNAEDAYRNDSTPLIAGDFVDLGVFSAGTTIDLVGIANGANGGLNGGMMNTYFSEDSLLNPDQQEHFVAFMIPDSPYLMIGFEDIAFDEGSDGDFNDLVFAIDMGAFSFAQLAPEPSTWAMMGTLAIFGIYLYRRQSRAE